MVYTFRYVCGILSSTSASNSPLAKSESLFMGECDLTLC